MSYPHKIQPKCGVTKGVEDIQKLYEKTIRNYSQDVRDEYENACKEFEVEHGADWRFFKNRDKGHWR